MTLLAWVSLSFDAFAHPLAMAQVGAKTSMTMAKTASSHCDDMAMMTHASHTAHPAPLHPSGIGHGCCANGGCYCASLCSGIADVPCLDVTWQPVHDPVLRFDHSEPTLVHAAPPLRPPIV